MPDLVTFGETMLRLSCPPGERLGSTPRFEVHVGGSESNVAVAASQLDTEAVWLSKLPDSALGRRVATALRSRGVRTGVAWVDPDEYRLGSYYLERGSAPRGSKVEYDRARSAPPVPEVLRMTQQAPAGCGGYLWRVFAGLAAVGVFFVLEALDVWAADVWTLALAVGGGALVAGLITMLVARRFPDEATDISFRLDAQRFTMRADGRTVVRVKWACVEAIGLTDGGEMVMRVDPAAVQGVRPVPPVLTAVDDRGGTVVLRFDLSDTDVPRHVLVSFLRATDPIPAFRSNA